MVQGAGVNVELECLEGVEGSGGYGSTDSAVRVASCACMIISTAYLHIKREDNVPCK